MYIKTPAVVEPISLSEAKAWLKIEEDETIEDSLITSLITASREWVEKHCNVCLTTTTIVEHYDCWHRLMYLQRNPIAITSIKYFADDAYSVLSSDVYSLDLYSSPARILIDYDYSLPVVDNVLNAIEIEYTSGFGESPSDVPAQIVQAIRLKLASMYTHREDGVPNYIDKYVTASMYLLRDYKMEFARV